MSVISTGAGIVCAANVYVNTAQRDTRRNICLPHGGKDFFRYGMFGRVATRYDKCDASFPGFVCLTAICILVK